MGLLLGVSAVTVFEVLDLLFYNLVLKCLVNVDPERKDRTKYTPEKNGKVIHKSTLDQAYENRQVIRENAYSDTPHADYTGFTFKPHDFESQLSKTHSN